MWGDAAGACSLSPEDPLSAALLQTTGPAHVPLTDPRWQDLFLHYDRLVHLDHIRVPPPASASAAKAKPSASAAASESDGGPDRQPTSAPPPRSVVSEACASAARHAAASSNLAALALHAARMVRDLAGSCSDGGDASSRIVLVGKARATCGALNLLRILSHEAVLAECGDHDNDGVVGGGGENEDGRRGATPSSSPASSLREAFTYRSRDGAAAGGGGRRPRDRNAAADLISSVLSFVCLLGGGGGERGGDGGGAPAAALLREVPELYDAAVQSVSLLLVLLSTQLYRPMESSLQQRERREAEGVGGSNPAANAANYFQNLVMEEARRERRRRAKSNDGASQQQQQWDDSSGLTGMEGFSTPRSSLPLDGDEDGSFAGASACADSTSRRRRPDGEEEEGWSARSVLSACLGWLSDRPRPPPRSISAHRAALAELVARHNAKGERPGPDGMYESYAIVMARAPRGAGGTDGADGDDDDCGGVSSSLDSAASMTGEAAPSSSLALSVATGSADPEHQALVASGALGPKRRSKAAVLADATRGVLHLSSSLFLLPFRLMSLAVALFGHGRHRLVGHGGAMVGGDGSGFDEERMALLRAAYGGASSTSSAATNDVLWLTDSPLADLGCSLFLLLANNCRAGGPAPSGGSGGDAIAAPWREDNPFREELLLLDDNRWDSTAHDSFGGQDSIASFSSSPRKLGFENGFDHAGTPQRGDVASAALTTTLTDDGQVAASTAPHLSLNFESLFAAFGRTLHTEAGELTLYTLLQSSPTFAASLAVRSDLDTLVLPLLRTLYFASDARQGRSVSAAASAASKGGESTNANGGGPTAPYRGRCFRSQSQLYVILILLLVFSQDSSFGPDSFRRVAIPLVPWYRERRLRDISLGSVLLLTLLRSVTFNLNKTRDVFLLSNCCAVLLNLSPHVSGLHGYAAMRLAAVTVSCMKKYAAMVRRNGGVPADDDGSSVMGMYREACNTLLQVVKHAVRARVVEGNVHLVYALVYLQTDFYDVLSAPGSPFFGTPEVGAIMAVVARADRAVQEDGTARTAEQTLEVLRRSGGRLKAAAARGGGQAASGAAAASHAAPSPERGLERTDSFGSSASSHRSTGTELSATDAGEFTFTYEEEADPEIFFVPYVWEVVACAVTAGTLEWSKERVKVFAAATEAAATVEGESEAGGAAEAGGGGGSDGSANYASDLTDAV